LFEKNVSWPKCVIATLIVPYKNHRFISELTFPFERVAEKVYVECPEATRLSATFAKWVARFIHTFS